MNEQPDKQTLSSFSISWVIGNANNFPLRIILHIVLYFRTAGDGNCLYNAASLHISKHESLSPLLRILTAVELYLYDEFYAQHSIFEEAYKRGKCP